MQNGEDGNRAAATTAAAAAAEAPSTAAPAAAAAAPARKKKVKKRKEKSSSEEGGPSAVAAASLTAGAAAAGSGGAPPPAKKPRKRKTGATPGGAARPSSTGGGTSHELPTIDPAQQAVYDQMRRALEEDQYSAVGSILKEGSDEEEEDGFLYRGQPVRLDRTALQQTAKKVSQTFWTNLKNGRSVPEEEEEDYDEGDLEDDGTSNNNNSNSKSKDASRNKKKRKKELAALTGHPGSMNLGNGGTGSNSGGGGGIPTLPGSNNRDSTVDFLDQEEDLDRDGGSIFGQTQGATNATWVECDKCKKWRRLRGVVDEKKLPPKWYCSMNRNDPERARCSAPEEDYDTQQTPESAADARTRKHLRVWVRRLQCQEAYEARQPTLTRGKKRAATTANSMKDNNAYEWVRCCNPSCGKWRAVLRFMDAKTFVMDRLDESKEWYCVMNTWDEKMASCAAPQENLPAVACPPWVLQDDE